MASLLLKKLLMITSIVEFHGETPFLVISFEKSAWTKDGLAASFKRIAELLEANGQQREIKLLIVARKDVETPPIGRYGRIVKGILRLRHMAARCADCTAILKESKSMDRFFSVLFKVFKPQRPLAFVRNMDDAFAFLQDPGGDFDKKSFKVVRSAS